MRPVSWVKAARKEFEKFPEDVQDEMADALTLASMGQKAEFAKPMSGLGSGVMELALPYRGDAYRAVYCLKLGDDIWVVHAFQKKSKSGIKTPKQDIDLVRSRIKQLTRVQQ